MHSWRSESRRFWSSYRAGTGLTMMPLCWGGLSATPRQRRADGSGWRGRAGSGGGGLERGVGGGSGCGGGGGAAVAGRVVGAAGRPSGSAPGDDSLVREYEKVNRIFVKLFCPTRLILP